MNTAERIAESDRRRAALAALAVAPAFRLPIRTLRAQLETLGYVVSIDRLASDCAWLAEQSLIDMQGETSATLTDRGLDVVMGRCTAPGVRRPDPGEL
jgi:hypothetical protein